MRYRLRTPTIVAVIWLALLAAIWLGAPLACYVLFNLLVPGFGPSD